MLVARHVDMVSYAKPARVLGETALILTEGSALVKASWLCRLRLARLLVEGGTDVNKTTDEGRTALMAACMTTYRDKQSTSKFKMVKFLLEHKADPNIRDKYGKTALMYACIDHAGVDVVSQLLEYSADPQIADKRDSSSLVYAINAGDSAILNLLIDSLKNQGKEVIIITTKEVGMKGRMSKQFLGVPPVLPGSPPFYQCVTPSEIEFKTSLKDPDIVKSVENLTSPFNMAVPEFPNRRQSNPTLSINSLNSSTNDTSVELECWNKQTPTSSPQPSQNNSPSGSPQPPGKSLASDKNVLELNQNLSSLHNRRMSGGTVAHQGTENDHLNVIKDATTNRLESHDLDCFQVSNPNSPTNGSPEDNERTEHLYIDAPPSHIMNNTHPVLNITLPDSKHLSPSPPVLPRPTPRPLTRRQSADIIRVRTMLHDIQENSGGGGGLSNSLQLHGKRFPLSEGCSPANSVTVSPVSTPVLANVVDVTKLPQIKYNQGDVQQQLSSSESGHPLRRKKSLPRMRPPLRKSQTAHDIKVPPLSLLLESNDEAISLARSCPDDLHNHESQPDTDKSIAPTDSLHSPRSSLLAPVKKGQARKKKVLVRRESMPQLLNDKLSRQRPGKLPPLKVNPNPPIPGIGNRFNTPPVLKRQTSDMSSMESISRTDALRQVSAQFDRRRMSMQFDDLQRVMKTMTLEGDNNNDDKTPDEMLLMNGLEVQHNNRLTHTSL